MSTDELLSSNHSDGKSEAADLRVHQAALYIRSAVKAQRRYQAPAGHEEKSVLIKRIDFIRPLALIGYLSISFFEKPSWCHDDSYDFDCTVHSHGRDHHVPMSSFPKLPQRVLHSFEILFILTLAIMEMIRVSFRRNTKTSLIRCGLIQGLSFLAICDNIQVIVTQGNLYFAQFIRPLIFLLIVRAVREVFLRIYYVLAEAKAVIGLLVLHVAIFSWVGKILFKNTAEGDLYFSSYTEALFNMFILLTNSNFPDIMLPVFALNGAYTLFFIVFSLLGMFFLLNILLGVFYSNYKMQLEQAAKKFAEEQHVDSDKLESRAIVDMLKTLIDSGIKIDPKIRKNITKLIDSEDLKKEVMNYDQPEETEEKLIYMPLAEVCCPTWFRSPGSCWQSAPYFLKSSFFEVAMNMFNLLNVASQVVLEFTTYYNYVTWWVYLQICFLAIYLTEMAIELALKGLVHYFDSYNRTFDLILNIASTSTLLYYFLIEDSDDSDLTMLKFFSLFRLFRILTLLAEVPQYAVIFKTFANLIPLFGTLSGVLMTLFYLYCLLGIEIYGGKIYSENPDLYNDSNINIIYTYINFNDFANGTMTLFMILVESNWNVIENMFEQVTNSWTRLYFTSFLIFGVFIALNLMVAFILDIFDTQTEYEKSKAALKS
mmetsp:Transcript_34366/g.60229  ORF Transcript_34366/g.60229 Transcript_34366/m.60229 type:complete len:654 (-) Transcript_34366:1428-3389(-)|eukprot:CAMPEP_0204900338 /NCGR_PEP_ID=MMETSP1397-20131031/2407_1 /ASSEMBLY_ACC=CAM_ASM_000891 /TAXON_ID=49980 /ORGANISM="Climacostomum Climacostomum virens, Strain Stock W-24" /LENGTH=653 /DNA_ID=CAMNT_0052068461 /DNA_START=74 /DNA_END=2035 /DNA_ORIENTATION=+